MFIDWNSKTGALTAEEFASLPRNSETGDILDLWTAYPFISDEQREELSEDDWSRMIDMDEEMSIMLADAAEEFGFA